MLKILKKEEEEEKKEVEYKKEGKIYIFIYGN